MERNDKLLSFIIPCYRSEHTIEKVLEEIIQTVSQRPDYDYEIICVNDASPDNVLQVLKDAASKNYKIKIVDLAKNKGKHAAILAGHALASGELIVDLDDDCQSPVYELWRLIAPIENDECDVVTANYYKKKESFIKRIGSKVNMLMTSIMLDKPRGMVLDNFSVMKRFVSDEMLKYKNPYPYFEGLVFAVTKRVNVIMMEQRERGDSQGTGYTLKKSISLWMNGLTAFSVKPLRLASVAGFCFALIGFCAIIYIILGRLVFHTIYVLGYASLMAIMLFSSGLMMLMLGMLGEYIGRIYISLNALPQYTIKATTNIDSNIIEQSENDKVSECGLES